MQDWAAQELKCASFGDARLKKRLIQMVQAFAAQPQASVPQACGSPAATKAAYRFWNRAHVTPDAIRRPHQRQTAERAREHPIVLAIQDKTELDFDAHPAQGMGPLSAVAHLGLHVHSVLLASLTGVPLGIVYQEVWARDPQTRGKAQQRRERPLEDKESMRWLRSLAATETAAPEEVAIITVADSEADIYALLEAPRRAGDHLLIRVSQDRRVEDEAGYLQAAIRQQPVRGEITVPVRRREGQPARQATLTVRFATLHLRPPRHGPPGRAAQAVQVILAEEEAPPEGSEALSWLLWTTWPVPDFAAAVECTRWYALRWLIERYHFVLKSGCRLEELQLEEAERTERALATYSLVAWRLLWLTYEARQNPEQPCDEVLEAHEWQSLYATIHRTTQMPSEVPTLHEAVRWIARLGGFLGRKHDGEPGLKTIWRGLTRLSDIADTWLLLHPESSTDPIIHSSG